jgi:hypothetical protein
VWLFLTSSLPSDNQEIETQINSNPNKQLNSRTTSTKNQNIRSTKGLSNNQKNLGVDGQRSITFEINVAIDK